MRPTSSPAPFRREAESYHVSDEVAAELLRGKSSA